MKIIWEKIKYEGNYMSFLETEILLKNWKTIYRESTTGKKLWSVFAIVEHTDNDSFIFVEQFRAPVKCKTLEFVAWITTFIK